MRRDVRELEPAGDVPGGEDMAEARPAAPVYTDVSPLELDAEIVQPETGDCGAAAGRDEERVAPYPFMFERKLVCQNRTSSRDSRGAAPPSRAILAQRRGGSVQTGKATAPTR